MTRISQTLWLGLSVLLWAGPPAGRAAEQPIQLPELMELLQSRLAGASAASLNEAAVAGLLRQLAPQVALVGAAEAATSAVPALSAALFERHYGYVRVARVTPGMEREFTNALARLGEKQALRGLAIDLRFAGGQDFAAALGLADLFFPDEKPLIQWGEGIRSSTSKPEAIVLPVVLLVNRETHGAAEALAGMLRLSEVGLLLGTNTAGRASVSREFTLRTGQRLRVAVAPVTVANNKPIPASGLPVDIAVGIPADDERASYDEAFKVLPTAARAAAVELSLQSTNRPARRRPNEAELVRLSREELEPPRPAPSTNRPGPGPEAPTLPLVHDPVLARAIDLLKGLAVVRQFRAP
ncbi:MAG: hypothetical protein RJA22_2168 [Verrucomicrobiota bacterium]|jgi:hypothetical protein